MRGLPRELWVLIAAAFIVALGYGIIAPILPQYARSFDVGVAAASLIVSAFAAMRLAFTPAAGGLIGRLGERRVYMSGLLIVAASTGLCAAAQSYYQLLFVRALGGVGSTMFTIAAMGLIVRLAPADVRGRTSALYGTSFLLGNVVGPMLGSALAFLGYRTPFVIYAIALVIAASVAGVLLPRHALRDRAEDARPPLTLRQALGLPAYRTVLISGFANGWTNFGVRIALLPLFAAAVPAIGAGFAGLGLTVFALANFVSLQGSGRLVDRLGRKPVLLAGLVICAAANLAFGWSGSVPVFLALSALGGIGSSLVAPSQQAMVADIIGRDRSGGQALATFSMAQDLGSIIGPILTGFVADQVGFGWAFGLSGALMVVATLAWLPVPDTMVRPAADDPR
ncbi:MFS transporter [Nigerium sp.]|uniref:MFS transporter n=1 Tax=Nigerium sp. TaxID=2042655 RepID=UPI003221EF9F